MIADGQDTQTSGTAGPVSLEERIRFTVRSTRDRFTWGEGKSFRIEQEIRLPDGTVSGR
jgi:hypothetical protein